MNSAYTRYVYAVDHNSAQALTTVNSLSEETSSISVFDGIGRTRVSVADHPGNAGGLRGSYQVYDILGRVSEWSNPTEIYGGANCGQAGQTACWLPYGDDASGYKYSTQTFDWKRRPLVTTNQDFTTRQIAYTGCGCAGGQVTIFTDEIGRQQKSYADFLGRTFKTELWNGAAVYSTNTTTFNVRDQATQIQELANASGATQNTTLAYDGFGRMWKSRKPIETADNTYLYFDDDKMQTKTDARGASTNYAYDNRGLLASVSYTVGSSGAAATNGATFQYNELGQRTQMDDGPGKVDYVYDTLGRMTSETRTFDLAGAPTTLFKITYGAYNLAGQVKNIKDPFDDEVNYSYDKIGRLATMTGATTFAGLPVIRI